MPNMICWLIQSISCHLPVRVLTVPLAWTTQHQFLSWQTSLLCNVEELAEGGSVDVAVGVGDR